MSVTMEAAGMVPSQVFDCATRESRNSGDLTSSAIRTELRAMLHIAEVSSYLLSPHTAETTMRQRSIPC